MCQHSEIGGLGYEKKLKVNYCTPMSFCQLWPAADAVATIFGRFAKFRVKPFKRSLWMKLYGYGI